MNSRDITRRLFLRGSAAAAVGAATGCGRRRGRPFTVFVYAGLDAIFEKHFAAPFRAKTGADVVLDAGWWDAIGKLKGSPKGEPAYDLVLTDATQGYPAIEDGMFRPIDFDRMPNLKALAPVALDNWVAKGRHAVTFHESALTLGWDRRQLGFTPTGWGDLLRDDLRGKLSLYESFYFSLYTFACMKAAADGQPGSAVRSMAENMGGVIDFAKRERDRVKFWWPTGTKMIQDLTQGNFAAGNAHSMTMLGVGREKPDAVGFVTPEADRAYVQLMWAIPADSPHPDLPEQAIDFLLSRDVQVAMARGGMGTAHVEAAKIVAAEDPMWAKTYPATDEQFKALQYFPYDAYFKDWAGIAKVWEQEVLRKS